MRDIKFRALDKKSKKMRVVYCIVYDTNSQFSKDPKIKLVNLWGKIFPAYDDGECNAARLIQREAKHVELMQYTGLLDKNGVEIFDKDIVRIGNYVFIVELDLLKGLFFRCIKHLSLRSGNVYYTSFVKDVEFEVIGNIYENSNLLKGEN